MTKAKRLREMITGKDLSFLMEAHNGLSAKIAEEAGFQGLWGSGLSLSASCGVRDNNELSWTQVLEILDYITDATSIPLLLDGDTGYGNFNNMRRLVNKLESRGVAGVCIEDKLFPKTNSFIGGEAQPLADIDEFSGKIKAGKDAQADDDFCIVARVEAFIAGWGLDEALKRASAYHEAGADAILMHSKKANADEVLAFKREWGDRAPVVIVPTKYYTTPTDVFREHGISTVIWANHQLRTSIAAMQKTTKSIFTTESLESVEDNIATVAEIFRLQGADELKEAEKIYLPKTDNKASAVILAASRGKELGDLTADKPKAMIEIGGRPIVERQISILKDLGVSNLTVVRGYKKDTIKDLGINCVDNDEYADTHEVYSLFKALDAISDGPAIISYGDILYRKHIADALLRSEADFCLATDPNWQTNSNKAVKADYVVGTNAYDRMNLDCDTSARSLITIEASKTTPDNVTGEWIGLMRTSTEGTQKLKTILREIKDSKELRTMRMVDLINRLIEKDNQVSVLYTTGQWVDVDELKDIERAGKFGG